MSQSLNNDPSNSKKVDAEVENNGANHSATELDKTKETSKDFLNPAANPEKTPLPGAKPGTHDHDSNHHSHSENELDSDDTDDELNTDGAHNYKSNEHDPSKPKDPSQKQKTHLVDPNHEKKMATKDVIDPGKNASKTGKNHDNERSTKS